jgi:hypothetical protein
MTDPAYPVRWPDGLALPVVGDFYYAGNSHEKPGVYDIRMCCVAVDEVHRLAWFDGLDTDGFKPAHEVVREAML